MHPLRATRDLAWDGCVNVRDLGGLKTATGANECISGFIRADNVRNWRRRHGARREGRYPYVWLDAKVEKVRDLGRVVRRCLELAPPPA